MQITTLDVVDFRSWAATSVGFEPGPNVILGANGHGKTNLVEAIVRASQGSSHRVAGDGPLVRVGADAATIRLFATDAAARQRSIEMTIGSATKSTNRLRVDGANATRTTDVLGVIPTVLFSPEDLHIVRESPDGRRRFLDTLLEQRRPRHGATRAAFDRALRQRNALLRSARGLSSSARAAALETLGDWTGQFAGLAAQVSVARFQAVDALRTPAADEYRWVAASDDDDRHSVAMNYASTVLDESDVAAGVEACATKVRDVLDAATSEEVDRGTTLYGPHRDDLELQIGGMPARTHASQGEAWSLALALRLASIDIIGELSAHPVVLLDDVFGELDADRRSRLATRCDQWPQTIITGAVASDIPTEGHEIRITRDGDTSSIVTSVAGVA